ncbi:hypothetical protein TL16_g02041 [Triparma laevis f. inornata]|uniref:VOC domain-containing protein n=1 Tax=Triparma laevis f. inornata TaxID=1714386 RepID=A0A9W6ZU72_9STRA|nr:hypothetical protein TL16_g02041 [Triparma laevis f. inornata]
MPPPLTPTLPSQSFNIPVFGSKTIWANCGASQIHLPTGPTGQKFRGRIGLLTSGPITPYLPHSISSTDTSCILQSPEGQEFHLRKSPEYKIDLLTYRGTMWSSNQNLTPEDTTDPVNLSKEYGKYEPESDSGGIIGLDYVQSSVPPSTLPKILKFYENIFGSTTFQTEDNKGIVAIGGVTENGECIQNIVFEENEKVEEYDGHHLAIYVASGVSGFTEVFNRAKDLGVVWVNPRFSDKADTLEKALECMQFRFKDIKDVDTGEVLYELEHEVRCSEHKDNRSDLD